MSARHPPGDGLCWQVADCTDLHSTADGSYELVVDKATLDALMSQGTGRESSYRREKELQQVGG